MALPTVQSVFDLARSFLGDDDVAGGTDWSNASLTPHYQSAFGDMYRIMTNLQSPKMQAETFYNLPAFTITLDPASAGITDLGVTIGMEERGGLTTLAITGAAPGTNQLVIQTAAHGLSAGTIITVNGVVGITTDVNGIWAVGVPDATHLTLNGCTATGTYVSGGVVTISSEAFVPMGKVDRIDLLTATPAQQLGQYAIEGVFYRFRPVSTARQLRIIYELSGTAPTANPTTTLVPVDDSRDYLALQTAYRAARARDLVIADQLKMDADFVIRAMANLSVRSLQGLAMRRPAFRGRRSQFALY